MEKSTAYKQSKKALLDAEQMSINRLRSKLWGRPGFLIRRLHQIHYAIFFEECAEDNIAITPVQHGILTVLLNRPWMDQTSISTELGLDRTTTADVVRRLEDKMLIKRQVNPNDKRSRQVYITSYGIEIMEQLRPRMQRAQERLIEPLSPEEQEQFMFLLAKTVEANNHYGRTILKKM